MPDSRFFKTIEPVSLKELADIGGCTLHNQDDASKLICGVAPLESATENEISFLTNSKYQKALNDSKAGACILAENNINKAPAGMPVLLSENPHASYAKIANYLHPQDNHSQSISKNAFIDDTAQISENCTIENGAVIAQDVQIYSGSFIGAGSYIGKGVIIGKNCRIFQGVTLSHCILGDNVTIFPGARIGQDGFGFATENGRHITVPQLGRVILENYVEVGANSCIDRGAGPDTIIGEGTRIDNLVQIGHNVQTGRGCVIVSQVGISGSTKLGDYVVLGGQAGLAGHLNIGSGCNAAAKSGVISDIEPMQIVGGSPAVPIKQWHRQTIALKNLTKKGIKKENV
ncbi:UDP-3-O-(3-hydroxymyristoyl)glucosamine N-acyltransferase [Rickettsiales bacterium]|nr:UDP-3-O-(3-hydroxymyristoyl)glucosamine N-acyltransferase [Rickettsiales bacterium]